MASKKSKLPNPKRVNYPPQTIFLDKAEPPPGSPRWRVEPLNLTKPTRVSNIYCSISIKILADDQQWAPTDPLGFSSDPALLNYDEWKGEYGAQKVMTDTYGLTNCVPVFMSQDWTDTFFESNGRYYL
ncbi:hypothetical protein PEX1_001680 [Penicillium expansum]|uniref:Uncharacterized protein n=1 Tax=Penicillium expansum TaxID=27334 RepID=A0A0A2IGL2_PENEN|nr:hypothetical protein PEX2_078860 [Penicillium expansum]KGO42237.1 hypothetical protein PEXP_051880 [Penicillium expansum]KGO55236.1 hypothetical protein PEX1_001680 [Penicillium expansum]KGO56279.1 hypothetical protein PEX2_078860 [Penicillium expansum]